MLKLNVLVKQNCFILDSENMKKSLAEKDKFNNKLKSLVLSKKKEIGLIKQQLNNLMEEKNVLMNKNNEFEKRWEVKS